MPALATLLLIECFSSRGVEMISLPFLELLGGFLSELCREWLIWWIGVLDMRSLVVELFADTLHVTGSRFLKRTDVFFDPLMWWFWETTDGFFCILSALVSKLFALRLSSQALISCMIEALIFLRCWSRRKLGGYLFSLLSIIWISLTRVLIGVVFKNLRTL